MVIYLGMATEICTHRLLTAPFTPQGHLQLVFLIIYHFSTFDQMSNRRMSSLCVRRPLCTISSRISEIYFYNFA